MKYNKRLQNVIYFEAGASILSLEKIEINSFDDINILKNKSNIYFNIKDDVDINKVKIFYFFIKERLYKIILNFFASGINIEFDEALTGRGHHLKNGIMSGKKNLENGDILFSKILTIIKLEVEGYKEKKFYFDPTPEEHEKKYETEVFNFLRSLPNLIETFSDKTMLLDNIKKKLENLKPKRLQENLQKILYNKLPSQKQVIDFIFSNSRFIPAIDDFKKLENILKDRDNCEEIAAGVAMLSTVRCKLYEMKLKSIFNKTPNFNVNDIGIYFSFK